MNASVNAYEAGTRKVIPAVLVYLRRSTREGEQVLMIHRNAGPSPDGQVDYHSGKWNGLGGKLNPDESPTEAARRELQEESGLDLDLDRFRPMGSILFPNFKAHKNEDWLVYLFVADLPTSLTNPSLCTTSEGELHWVLCDDISKLNLWPGDREFLPQVFGGQPVQGTIWYRGNEVSRARVETYGVPVKR